jgi:dsRNA-specific ribonuclease
LVILKVNDNYFSIKNGRELSRMRSRIDTLSLERLENLGEALLDFTSADDLQVWLEALEAI